MRRRSAVLCLVAAVGVPRLLLAQAGRQYRIAYLTGYSAEVDAPLFAAFKRGLSDLGYIEGRNIAIEARQAAGQPERLPALAAELVARKPDIYVVGGSAPAT